MPPAAAAAAPAIASAVGGVANAVSASGAAKAQRKQTGRATGYYNQAIDSSNRGYRRGASFTRRGMNAAVGGYDDAIRSFGGVGRGATQSVLDSRKQQLDAIEGQGIRSGFGASPSTMRSAQRGTMMDSQRAMLQIQDALGQGMAQLQIGRGNAMNAGNQALAGNAIGAGGQEADILQRLAGFLGNIQHTGGNANFQGIGELLQLLGSSGGGRPGTPNTVPYYLQRPGG